MTGEPDNPLRRVADLGAVFARLLVGALFVFMGLSKALHPVEFLKMVRLYDVTQNPVLLNAIAAALPWFEVICGAMLVAGIAVRGSALVLIGLLVPFTWMVLRRALALHLPVPFCSIKFDCGCGTGQVYVCWKLTENVILILLSGWLLAGYGRKFALRYRLI